MDGFALYFVQCWLPCNVDVQEDLEDGTFRVRIWQNLAMLEVAKTAIRHGRLLVLTFSFASLLFCLWIGNIAGDCRMEF
jgi:hypothetical protein